MSGKMKTKKILSEEDIKRALVRLTHQILERKTLISGLILIGIQTRGVYLAQRIQAIIKSIENIEIPLGVLDITFYRDDLTVVGNSPVVKKTKINFDLNQKEVILIDDVLFTGRTVRAALDEIMDFGRPRLIELLALVDRGHRELPIRADYVGKNIPTSAKEQIEVHLSEIDEVDEVVVIED